MSEKMLVTQALDERDLLVKKITHKIQKASFVDIIKPNEKKVYENRILKDDFLKETQSSYQQIIDLIDYFKRIDAAIIVSNANSYIETSYGSMSVASAISLRNRLRGTGTYDDRADFETILYDKMNRDYNQKVGMIESKNKQLKVTEENMRLSILGKEVKVKDDKPLEVVDAYVKENTFELVDPLSILKKMDALKDKKDILLRELDTQIKVSNATTFIEI